MRQGICSGCGRAAWINFATINGAGIGEYCADCFVDLEHDPSASERVGGHSGHNHNNPGFDNVVRALEEDR